MARFRAARGYGVCHAAMGSQYLFGQAFHLKVGAMADESKSPLRRLGQMTGRKLA
jgi:hypothetical protein